MGSEPIRACEHTADWLPLYFSAVQSGYEQGYAAAQADDQRFADLVARRFVDLEEQGRMNAVFVKQVLSMIDTERERRKRGIK